MERLGIGIGWRPEIAADIAQLPGIDWVEVVAENICPDHLPDALRTLLDGGTTVVPHGVSLGLGDATRPDPQRLAALAERAEALAAPLVTEHIAFVRGGGPLTASPGIEAGHLLPVPRTRDALDVLCANVRIAQDALPVPLALENIAALFRWPDEELTEGQFLTELVERTGVHLLIDVANLHTNHVNRGEDPATTLDALPVAALAYVHVAGGIERDGIWHDSHAHPVTEPVLDVLAELCARVAPPGVLLERDEAFPAAAELAGELDAIRSVLTGAAGRRPAPGGAAASGGSGGSDRSDGSAGPDGPVVAAGERAEVAAEAAAEVAAAVEAHRPGGLGGYVTPGGSGGCVPSGGSGGSVSPGGPGGCVPSGGPLPHAAGSAAGPRPPGGGARQRHPVSLARRARGPARASHPHPPAATAVAAPGTAHPAAAPALATAAAVVGDGAGSTSGTRAIDGTGVIDRAVAVDGAGVVDGAVAGRRAEAEAETVVISTGTGIETGVGTLTRTGTGTGTGTGTDKTARPDGASVTSDTNSTSTSTSTNETADAAETAKTAEAGETSPAGTASEAGPARPVSPAGAREVPDPVRQQVALAQTALLSALVAGTPVPEGFDRARIRVQGRALLAKRCDVIARVAPELPQLLGADYRPAFWAYARSRPLSAGYRRDALAFVEHLLAVDEHRDPALRRSLTAWWQERAEPAPPTGHPAARLWRAARLRWGRA